MEAVRLDQVDRAPVGEVRARSAGRGRRAPSGSRATRPGRRTCGPAARAAGGRRARPRRRGRGRPQARSARPRVRPGRSRPAPAARGASQSVWSTPTVRGPTRSGVAISVRTPRPLRSGPASSSVGSWMHHRRAGGHRAGRRGIVGGDAQARARRRSRARSWRARSAAVRPAPSAARRRRPSRARAAGAPGSPRAGRRGRRARARRRTGAGAAGRHRPARAPRAGATLLSTATAVRRASSSATAMSSGPNGGRSPQARSSIAPSVRPRAASGRISADRASIWRTTSMCARPRRRSRRISSVSSVRISVRPSRSAADMCTPSGSGGNARNRSVSGARARSASATATRRMPPSSSRRSIAHTSASHDAASRATPWRPASGSSDRASISLACSSSSSRICAAWACVVAGVLEGDRECARAAALGIADRGADDVDADARAVLAHRGHLTVPDAARRAATRETWLGELAAELLGGAPDDLGGLVPEQPLGLAVPGHDRRRRGR